jgi:fructoselysine-6-P-deglycase FrlB-like protein
MTELSEYVARAKKSVYFSGARIADDLDAFLRSQAKACESLGDESSGDIDHVYLVGSGGSLANLISVKYLLDRWLAIPSDVVASYDLVWRKPACLNKRSLVFLASFSGETEDTVAALRFARSQGARTVGIVASADSSIGREADVTIPYASAACYESPIVALVLFAARLAADGRRTEATAAAESLTALPGRLREVLAAEEQRAEERARASLPCTHMYVLGAGPLSALAYKVAMSVLMENVRIGGTYCDATEFRHGPAEALERTRPDMMFLIGTDESREMTLRTLGFCRDRASTLLTYDAAEFGDVHPLLTPLVMNSVVQWFVVYSALLRGILDLDDRVFMGQGVLAEGGARWP